MNKQGNLIMAMIYFIISFCSLAFLFLFDEWKRPDESLFMIDVFLTYFCFRMGWVTLTRRKKEYNTPSE
jgi:hypothetical protein